MILSDRSIREALASGRIEIDPLNESYIQPSSVDLTLDCSFIRIRSLDPGQTSIDLKEPTDDLVQRVEIASDTNRPFVLSPGQFALGSTAERVKLSSDLVARIEGKSSLGRLGLLIHATAGFIDAGWDGYLTLELSNIAPLPLKLYPGMKIGQISFLQMTTAADEPYGSTGLGSKYQHQRGPTPSRYWENFS